MAIQISNTPAPVTAVFRANSSPLMFIYFLPIVLLWLLRGINVPVIVFFLVLLTFLVIIPATRTCVAEISRDEVVWRKKVMGIVWSTHRTRFSDIFTIRWIQQRWPWYSRSWIPSHIVVKLLAGGSFRFAMTVKIDEYRRFQNEIETNFPDLYRVTENPFAE